MTEQRDRTEMEIEPGRVLVLADLHLDIWVRSGLDPLALIPAETWSSLDALIIAGDLSNNPLGSWPVDLRKIGAHMPLDRVHLFPGNHDYFSHALDDEAIMGRAAVRVGANFAQKAQIVVGRTRFLCCTLWTDFELLGDPVAAKAAAYRGMTDYRSIFMTMGDFRVLRPDHTLAVHRDHRAWLESSLAEAFDGETIVVTHHAPVPDGVRQPVDELGPAFGSDLRELIEAHQPRAWYFGHTHWPFRGRVGRTEVINFSVGYPSEVPVEGAAAFMTRGLVTLGRNGAPAVAAPAAAGDGGASE